MNKYVSCLVCVLSMVLLAVSVLSYGDRLIYIGSRNVTNNFFNTSGINESFANSTYLRLDASNDPITDNLNLTENLSVSGGTIYMGDSDDTSTIYFWDDISGPGTGPTGEYLMWNDTVSNFQFSDSLELINGHLEVDSFIMCHSDIMTSGDNDNLYLGEEIMNQEESDFKAYASGKLNITGPFENRGWTSLGNFTKSIIDLGRRAGDIFSSGRAFFENTITSFSPEHGTGLVVRNYGDEINLTSLGMTGTLNGDTQVLCDSTNPFLEEHEGMILTVLDSNPSYTDATGEIKSYLNSSCISLSFGSADYEEIVSATYMTYYIYPHPAFMVLDNGFISSYVGTNPDSRFEIHILNGTGFHGVYIEDVAGADQHQTITTNTDMKGKQGVVGFNSFLYSSTPIGVEEAIKSDNIKLEIDATNINQSRLAFLSTSIIGTPSKNTQIDGIHMDVAVNNIITMGSQDVLAKIYNESTDISNVMTGIPYTILSHDNDVLYLGDTVDFTIITFHFDTPSSGDLLFNYYYCDESHEYVSLGTVLDTTNGFKTSGTISFTNPSDRGDCNKSLDGTPFADMTNYTYIAIERTKNNVVTPPILDDITVSGATPRFILRDDMMKFNPVNTAPETCPLNTRDESMLGAMYFDISEDGTCECRAGGWKVIRDGSICT